MVHQTTNTRKYENAESNLVVKLLMKHFFYRIRSLWPPGVTTLLDAGCGQGHALVRLEDRVPDRVTGIDKREELIETCRRRLPSGEFRACDIHDLPFDDSSFDLVLCLEVLEHLERPDVALRELERVSSKWVLASVPHEPWIRIGNMCRGKHLTNLGSHPDHVQHWSSRGFRRFVADRTDLRLQAFRHPFPWLAGLWRCGP